MTDGMRLDLQVLIQPRVVEGVRIPHAGRRIERYLLPVLFFQAEDGIRDYKVTGVQTCALPILSLAVPLMVNVLVPVVNAGPEPGEVIATEGGVVSMVQVKPAGVGSTLPTVSMARTRSEERRVGKECRSRWSPYH